MKKSKKKKITIKQWIKIVISITFIAWILYLILSADILAEYIANTLIGAVVTWLFMFILWLPEQRVRWSSKAYKKKEKAKWEKKTPSRFLNKMIIKANWMDNVYNEICLTYLSKKEQDHTIPMMEKVLFLMHEKSLTELDRPFIRKKIYLNGKDVRIAFLSDRFRVKELERVEPSQTYSISQIHPPDYWQYMRVYEIMLKDYMDKSEAELDVMVEAKSSRALPKGVIRKPYHNWLWRYTAREEYYSEHKKMTVLRFIASFFILLYNVSAILGALLLPLTILDNWLQFAKDGDHDRGFILFVFMVCTVPKIIHWVTKYRKPTPFEVAYEKEHPDR